MRQRLSRAFVQREPEVVARELLGKIFVHETNRDVLEGKIVEVEAYLAENDEAAHSFRGKDERNQSL